MNRGTKSTVYSCVQVLWLLGKAGDEEGRQAELCNPSENADMLEQYGPSVATPISSFLLKTVLSKLLPWFPNLFPYFQTQLLIITRHNVTNSLSKFPLYSLILQVVD